MAKNKKKSTRGFKMSLFLFFILLSISNYANKTVILGHKLLSTQMNKTKTNVNTEKIFFDHWILDII